MKYYQFEEPYFAVISANNKEEAISIYKRDIADFVDSDEEPSTVGKYTALGMYSQIISSAEPCYKIRDLLCDFDSIANGVLLVDKCLV